MDPMSDADALQLQKVIRKTRCSEKDLSYLNANSINGLSMFQITNVKPENEENICNPKNVNYGKENRRWKNYFKKIENEVSFLQKENNSLDKIMLKKVRRLHKLKAENLYLKSVIKNNTAIKSLLIALNDLLRSLQPLDMAQNSDDHLPEGLFGIPINKNNCSQDSVLQIPSNNMFSSNVLSSNIGTYIQLKQNASNSAGLELEATSNRDSLMQFQHESFASKEAFNDIKESINR